MSVVVTKKRSEQAFDRPAGQTNLCLGIVRIAMCHHVEDWDDLSEEERAAIRDEHDDAEGAVIAEAS